MNPHNRSDVRFVYLNPPVSPGLDDRPSWVFLIGEIHYMRLREIFAKSQTREVMNSRLRRQLELERRVPRKWGGVLVACLLPSGLRSDQFPGQDQPVAR